MNERNGLRRAGVVLGSVVGGGGGGVWRGGCSLVREGDREEGAVRMCS